MYKLLLVLAAFSTAEGVALKYDYTDKYTYVGPMRSENGLKVNEDSMKSEMSKFSKTLEPYHYDNAKLILEEMRRSQAYPGTLPAIEAHEELSGGMTFPHVGGKYAAAQDGLGKLAID